MAPHMPSVSCASHKVIIPAQVHESEEGLERDSQRPTG